jgi:hypothetical protein
MAYVAAMKTNRSALRVWRFKTAGIILLLAALTAANFTLSRELTRTLAMKSAQNQENPTPYPVPQVNLGEVFSIAYR